MVDRLLGRVTEDAEQKRSARLKDVEGEFRRLKKEYKRYDAVVKAFRLREKLQGIGHILGEKLGYQFALVESDPPELISDLVRPRIQGDKVPEYIGFSLEWWNSIAYEADRYRLYVDVSNEVIEITFGHVGENKKRLEVVSLEENRLDDVLFEAYSDPVLPSRLTRMA